MALTAITKDFITRSGIQVQGTSTVTSSTGQTKALQVNGGAAIAKNLIVGQDAKIYGPTTVYGTFTAAGGFALEGALDLSTATIGTLIVDEQLTVTAPATLSGVTTLSGTTTVSGAISASNTATFTGNTFLNGTTTVGGAATFNSTVDLNGAVTVDGASTFNNTATFNAPLVVSGSNTLTVGTGATTLGGILDVNDTTAATSAGAGAVQVAGGVYVEKNLIVTGTGSSFDTSTWTSNALAVDGGAYIKDGLFVEGPTTFGGAVTFSGTATYVYSTNTYYTDNLINMHVPPGGIGTNWTADDGKDIGLVFHYFKGADKNAFLGFANDTGYLEWYENGSEVGGVYSGSAYGTFKTANVQLVGTDNATSTATGALRVAGGAGIGGDAYVGGVVNGAGVTARDLTENRLALVGANGRLVDSASLTWNTSTNTIQGTITSANTATNLAGGSAGAVVYQSAAGVTSFVTIGGEDTVLTSKGGVPTWTSSGATSVGSATTATNLSGGSAGYIPVQFATGITGFDADLTFNTTTNTLSVTNVAVAGTTNSTSTTTGAVVVAGGVGIGQDLRVGGTIYGNLTGTATNALQSTTATNATTLIGGAAGSVVYQSSTGTTSFLPIGVETYILTSIGGAPSWQAPSATTVGASTTATNIAGGATGYIPVQSATGVTGFDADLTFNTATNTLATVNLTASGTVDINDVTNATSTTTGALTVAGGVGIEKDVWVGGQLYVNGSPVLTSATFVTPTLQSVTTAGATTDRAISFTNTTSSTSTTTGALTVAGGVGIGGNLNVGQVVNVGGNSQVAAATVSATSTSTLVVDSFALATYRSAKYFVQIEDGSNFHVTEIAVFHNGTNVYMNEYGTFFNSTELGVFDAAVNGSNIELSVTPSSATAKLTFSVTRLETQA